MSEQIPQTQRRRKPLQGPLLMFYFFGYQDFNEVRSSATKVIASSVHVISLGMELATYYRYYYHRERTLSWECLLLFLTCLALDVLIWRAHWSMARDDPGYLNDSESIVKASQLDPEAFNKHIEATISRLTGLEPGSADWPQIIIKRCSYCAVVKTEHVHHCSQCEKCVFMMDHHCCFSDNCVGYYSLKPFVQFTGSVVILFVFGMTVIWVNLTMRNIVHEEGLTSFADCLSMIFLGSPAYGSNFWTIYDMVHIQISFFHGLIAVALIASFAHATITNECDIDTLKKESLRQRGLQNQVRDRPQRTYSQALAFIFGKRSVSMRDFMRPDGSGRGKRPELTFELMIEACIDEFKAGDAQGYQRCDEFLFNKAAHTQTKHD